MHSKGYECINNAGVLNTYSFTGVKAHNYTVQQHRHVEELSCILINGYCDCSKPTVRGRAKKKFRFYFKWMVMEIFDAIIFSVSGNENLF